MAQKLLFLVNPHAGRSEIKNYLLEIVDQFTKEGWDTTVVTTQRAGQIPLLLDERRGEFQRVVCCGGDGTLNETINGLMNWNPRPLLGYIPAGTTNDFASSLGLHRSMPDAGRTCVQGEPFPVDIGRFGNRYFAYVAAFGAFTSVSYGTPQHFKNLLGRAAYILEGILSLPTIKTYSMTVECDGQIIEGDYVFGMVANSTSVGGIPMGRRLDVSLNDGLLELVLVKYPHSAIEAQQLLTALAAHEPSSELLRFCRASSFRIHSQEPLSWTLDGEFGGEVTDVEIKVCPQAISVLTPSGAVPGTGENHLAKED